MNLEVREVVTTYGFTNELINISSTLEEAKEAIKENEDLNKYPIEYFTFNNGFSVYEKEKETFPFKGRAYHDKRKDAVDEMKSLTLEVKLKPLYESVGVFEKTILKGNIQPEIKNIISNLYDWELDTLYHRFLSKEYFIQIFEGEGKDIQIDEDWFIFKQGTYASDIHKWFKKRMK